VAYKPKKGGEADPEIEPLLQRGLRYVEEFAAPETKKAAAKPAAVGGA